MQKGMWWGSADTGLARVAMKSGMDILACDLQHSLMTQEAVRDLAVAMQPGDAELWMRVAANESTRITRAFDLGATTVIVPLVNNADEARAAVAASLHQPKGTRSFGPRSTGPDGAAIDGRCVVMVENRQGLENLPEIVRVPDLAGVLVGPADLALDLGLTLKAVHGLPDESLRAALRGVADTCRDTGISSGVALMAWSEIPIAEELGFDWALAGGERALLTAAFADRLG